MKKLIFIDNDDIHKANEDKRNLQCWLSASSNLDDEYLKTMIAISDIHTLNKSELTKNLFNENNCIITASQYTE